MRFICTPSCRGAALLDCWHRPGNSAKEASWALVFEANARAQYFYEKAGFSRGCAQWMGAGNDEKLPDILV